MVLRVYEDLEVYQLAFEKALQLHALSLEFPKIEQFAGIADQVRRSSKGICANLAEGMSKQMSLPDKRRFLKTALGSSEETRVWLAFAARLGYLNEQQAHDLRNDYTQISQMLFKLEKSLSF